MKRIWDAVEKFRNSKYYAEAEWDRIRSREIKKLVDNLIEKFTEYDVNIFKDELKKWLRKWSMAHKAIPKQVVENNDPLRLSLALMNLAFSKGPIEEKTEMLRKLKYVDFFVATELIALFDDNYVCYHSDLVEAIKTPMIKQIVEYIELELPKNLDELEENLKLKEYLKLNEICNAIMSLFNFRDLWEVHEFLWHGNKTNWEFAEH